MGALPATIGLRVHSGWAAMVVLAGDSTSPKVIARKRIEMTDPRIPGAAQPYHQAEGLNLKKAEQIVKRCSESARALARKELGSAIDELRGSGYCTAMCGIIMGSGRPATSLEATLASHPMIHTAEGELFREALRHASEQSGVPVTGIREKDLQAVAAEKLKLSIEDLQRELTGLGKPVGRPWRQDEKLATLIAWLLLRL